MINRKQKLKAQQFGGFITEPCALIYIVHSGELKNKKNNLLFFLKIFNQSYLHAGFTFFKTDIIHKHGH
jgi:hypothetical protein